MNVYAITERNERFLMFVTQSVKFAHENAARTAPIYDQRLIAYEIEGVRFPLGRRCRIRVSLGFDWVVDSVERSDALVRPGDDPQVALMIKFKNGLNPICVHGDTENAAIDRAVGILQTYALMSP